MCMTLPVLETQWEVPPVVACIFLRLGRLGCDFSLELLELLRYMSHNLQSFFFKKNNLLL